ncbi:MAG: WYL domain-containing protein [Planctomycetota bacterium]|nr:WYL domain-containing protein [Planctomycetota bacterium]
MNISRVYRLLKLITILQSGRQFDAEALAKELAVSRRTLFRDLNMLHEADVPYRFDRGLQSYSIADSFFLPPLQLNLDESLALLLMTRKFLSRQIHPAFRHALNAGLKIESNLPAAVRKYCVRALESVSVRWPPCSSASAAASVFDTILHALVEKQQLEVRYDSLTDGRELDLLLDPWRLVFMTRGWYLIANDQRHGEARTYKIDRFLKVETAGRTRRPPPIDFTEETHFGAAWLMIPEGTLYRVKLRFSARVASNLEEVVWHKSQTTTRLDDGRLIFNAEVDGLGEITWWILGYGDEVEVLEPPELRRRILDKAGRMVALAASKPRADTA